MGLPGRHHHRVLRRRGDLHGPGQLRPSRRFLGGPAASDAAREGVSAQRLGGGRHARRRAGGGVWGRGARTGGGPRGVGGGRPRGGGGGGRPACGGAFLSPSPPRPPARPAAIASRPTSITRTWVAASASARSGNGVPVAAR